jgi:uracil-DNA glycosylase
LDDPLALLRLQIEWGADEALGPDPVDRLGAAVAPAAAARPLPRAVPPATPAASPVAAASRQAPAERALAVAAQATSLEQLRDAIAGFDGCGLRDTASNLVWSEGDPDGAALIVGEAPGRDEDRTGRPFAGADGALLEQMLGSIGLTRSEVLLAPLLPWRPPGGRPPNAVELAICLPFLHRLIALAQPNRLLIFGNTAARTLLAGAAARRRPTPAWIDSSIPGLRTMLPSLVLPGFAEMQKAPSLHRNAWAGLRLLRRAIDAR